MTNTAHNVRDAVIGIGSTGGGVAVSFMESAAPHLRFASLVVGFLIGLIILWKHIRHWNDKP